MSTDPHRSVSLERTSLGHYEATNARGGRLAMGTGDDTDFTPVELLLAAMGGCMSVDVDHMTSRRAQPTRFTVTVEADKLADEQGSHLGPVTITLDLGFPEGEAGDSAREVAPRAVRASHDRQCTVSRTVMLPTEVTPVLHTDGRR